MGNHVSRIFLAVACIVLAIPIMIRPRPAPPVLVSDNGIVPPSLLREIADQDAILERPVDVLSADNAPLDESIRHLAEMSKTKIDVNWEALEGAGIDRAAPVLAHLHHGTLRQALKLLGDSAGRGIADLGYNVQGNAIEFSTVEDLLREDVTEIYNLRPLIEKIRTSTTHAPGEQAPTEEETVEMITKLITDTVDPNGWRGNTTSTIQSVNGLLVVTETRQYQREIAELLTRLNAELGK